MEPRFERLEGEILAVVDGYATVAVNKRDPSSRAGSTAGPRGEELVQRIRVEYIRQGLKRAQLTILDGAHCPFHRRGHRLVRPDVILHTHRRAGSGNPISFFTRIVTTKHQSDRLRCVHRPRLFRVFVSSVGYRCDHGITLDILYASVCRLRNGYRWVVASKRTTLELAAPGLYQVDLISSLIKIHVYQPPLVPPIIGPSLRRVVPQ